MQTRARTDAAKDGRRRTLLDAALKLFSLRGYGGTTIEAIAAEAGLSPAAFYRYFPSKVEIYRALNAEAVDCLNTAFAAALDRGREEPAAPSTEAWPPSPARRARSRLEALAGAYLRFFDEHRELYLVAEVLHLGEPEFFEPGVARAGTAPLLEAGALAILEIVKEVLAEGSTSAESVGGGEAGEGKKVADPWETALALWAMLDGVLIAAVKRAEEYTGVGQEKVAARALEIMLDGVAAGEPGAGR
jgi:AcrR family transcriptional regulator